MIADSYGSCPEVLTDRLGGNGQVPLVVRVSASAQSGVVGS